MPVTGQRFKMLFSEPPYGFSESHILPTLTDFNATQVLALQLLKARQAINAPQTSIVGAELSQIGHFRRVLTLDPATYSTFPSFNYSGSTPEYQAGQANKGDQAKACLLAHGYAGVDHRKSIFLAGCPDALVGEGLPRANPDAIPLWRAAFNAYATVLSTKGWGFPVRRGDSEGNTLADIQSVFKTNPDVRAWIAVLAGDLTVGVGDRVQVMFSKMDNVAYTPLNATWYVDAVLDNSPVVGQTAIALRGSGNVDPSHLLKYGGVRILDYTSVLYTSVAITSATTRKRGNRSLVGPGKAKRIHRI